MRNDSIRQAFVVPPMLLAFTMAAATNAAAQLPPLVTDRPDFTESTEVAGRGMLQVEGGLTVDSNPAGSTRARTLTAPAVLLRIGVSEHLEIRVSDDGLVSQWTPSSSSSGRTHTNSSADLVLGAKYKFLSQATGPFDIAILSGVSLPIGSDRVSSGQVDPELKLAWGRDLPHGFGLTGNINLASVPGDSGRSWQRALTASLGHGLGRDWAGFWEVYGFFPRDKGVGEGWTFDGGVTRMIGDSLQLDASAGVELTSAAPGWFIGAGLSVRTRMFH